MRESNEGLNGELYKTSFSIPKPVEPPEKVYVWIVSYSTPYNMSKCVDASFSTEQKAISYISTKKNKMYYYVDKKELL